MGAESKRRYVNPTFQPSTACPSLAAIYCMWPKRCFVMEGEDTWKSHKGYLCLCKNAFVHTLTINMPDFTCSVLVWSCDTCMPDKICWAQNKSRIRSWALYKPSNSSTPFWEGHCLERLNWDVDLCLICFLLFIIGHTSIYRVLINNLLVSNERCYSNSWTVFPGVVLPSWETLGEAALYSAWDICGYWTGEMDTLAPLATCFLQGCSLKNLSLNTCAHTKLRAWTYLRAQVCAHVPHHPSPYSSQVSFWDRAKLAYGGVVVPGAYARGRTPLLLPCTDPEEGKKALYNKGQPKPPGKAAVVMLIPWGTRMSQFA